MKNLIILFMLLFTVYFKDGTIETFKQTRYEYQQEWSMSSNGAHWFSTKEGTSGSRGKIYGIMLYDFDDKKYCKENIIIINWEVVNKIIVDEN